MLHHRSSSSAASSCSQEAGAHQGGPFEAGNLRPQLGRESGEYQTGVAEGSLGAQIASAGVDCGMLRR